MAVKELFRKNDNSYLAVRHRRLSALRELGYTLRRNGAELDLLTWSQPNTCGTVKCFIGYATQHKPFNSAGFKEKPFDHQCSPLYLKGTKVYGHWDAVTEFFHINFTEAYAVFQLNHYRGEVNWSIVLERLSQLIHDTEYMQMRKKGLK